MPVWNFILTTRIVQLLITTHEYTVRVCLESAILEAPSLYTQTIIQDKSNALVRIIDVDPASGWTNTRLDKQLYNYSVPIDV